jgi:hypothetical protein
MKKEERISRIKRLIESLYDIILNTNKTNNFIADIKSFYIFIFFIEMINSFISTIIRIELYESNSSDVSTNSFTEPEILLTNQFILKTINILECFIAFMYNYIIYVIQGFYCRDKFRHSFLLNKINAVVKRNMNFFKSHSYTGNDEVKDVVDKYICVNYEKNIMKKAYIVIKKITDNIKIYTKNNEDINNRIDFIKYVNFDGYQYIMRNNAN